MAYLVWNEVPGWNTLAGMLLIVGSGLYLGYREIKQAKGTSEPVPTAETVFIPGGSAAALPYAADRRRRRLRTGKTSQTLQDILNPLLPPF